MSIYKKDKAIMKTIRISQIENDNWDINRIHDFLEGKLEVNQEFKRLYEIMNLYLIDKLSSKQISSIPEPILKEIKLIEEKFNFD